jgi:ABC-type multidrug transport system ATPase subunit
METKSLTTDRPFACALLPTAASVDVATDARLQPLIREVFGGMTLLTIAHRLNTVITMDYILVLSAGEMVEYDRPHTLLAGGGKPNQNGSKDGGGEGALSAMVDAMGETAAKQLRAAAAAAAAAAGTGGSASGGSGGEASALEAREARLAQLSNSGSSGGGGDDVGGGAEQQQQLKQQQRPQQQP